jgi:hypothetical protein
MRTRILVLVVLAVLLGAPAAAPAQDGSPFDGLPPAPPPPAPTVQPVETDDGSTDRQTLYVIGGALLVVMVGIGWMIARDARRSAPPDARDDPKRLREQGPHKHERKAKAKARAKGRAQRQARKAGRRH